MSADNIFALLVYLTLPAAVVYPAIYGTQTKWWKGWIGRGLFISAAGLAILLVFTAAYQIFGPNYVGRDTVRIVGMVFVCVGTWLGLAAMLRALYQRRP